MNITALRPKCIGCLEPLANVCITIGMTPNQISLLSLIFGIFCGIFYFTGDFLVGSLLLFTSGIFDLVDGIVARKMDMATHFGAVIDWIIDKYVDVFALLGIGLSGIASISRFFPFPSGFIPIADFSVVAIAILGSMMNTFIKPVVYAEVGFRERSDGKINDPLEGVGFFGRPETLIVLIIGGITGYIWISVLIVAICTNLSAIQRIWYLYRKLS